jgi:hypothetical protein
MKYEYYISYSLNVKHGNSFIEAKFIEWEDLKLKENLRALDNFLSEDKYYVRILLIHKLDG